jgi:hypothetical protein
MKVLGVTTVRAPRQSNQRRSHIRVKTRWTGDPAELDSALLIETELFAKEEILGRERASGSQPEKQEAEQIGKQVQPARAEIHDAPMPLVFDVLLSLWLLFFPFQVTPQKFLRSTDLLKNNDYDPDTVKVDITEVPYRATSV